MLCIKTDGQDDDFIPSQREGLTDIGLPPTLRKRVNGPLAELESMLASNSYDQDGRLAPDYNCPTKKRRVGGVGLGGAWVCGLDLLLGQKQPPCVVYTYTTGTGTTNKHLFELEMAGRTKCQVHLIDPDMGPLPDEWKNEAHDHRLNLHKHALRPTRADADYLLDDDLLDTMKELGHPFIDILKVGRDQL